MIHKLWNRCVWVVFESIFACITHAHAAAKAGRPQRGLVGGGTSGNGHQQRLGLRTTCSFVGLCWGRRWRGYFLDGVFEHLPSALLWQFVFGPRPPFFVVLAFFLVRVHLLPGSFAFFLVRIGFLPGTSWHSSWVVVAFLVVRFHFLPGRFNTMCIANGRWSFKFR